MGRSNKWVVCFAATSVKSDSPRSSVPLLNLAMTGVERSGYFVTFGCGFESRRCHLNIKNGTVAQLDRAEVKKPDRMLPGIA